LVNRVGAGMFVGLTVTAALITSLVVDHFGWFRMQVHPVSVWRVLGGLLMVAGVSLIARS
jgi:bacterial/archaeal transporter family-2 protein